MLVSSILLIIYLFLSAFFSASETAFTSLSIADINSIKRSKKYFRQGVVIQHFYDNPNSFLTTVLICNNLVNVLISVTTTTLAMSLSSSWVIVLTTALTTIVLLVFGEIIPKQIAIVNNIGIIKNVVLIIKFLSIVLFPVIHIFNLISKFISSVFSKSKNLHQTDDIMHMISYAKNMGIIDRYKSHVITSIFQWENTSIKSIITRRQDMIALDEKLTIKESISKFIEYEYSEFPTYKDNKENIKGIVSLVSCIKEYNEGNGDKRISDIANPPIFLPQSISISEFLQQNYQSNMFVILDEYGGLEGYIKKQDIAKLFDLDIISENLKGWTILKGSMPLQKFLEYFSIELINEHEIEFIEDIDTVSGYVIKQNSAVPVVGSIVKTDIGFFKIEIVENGIILKLSYRKKK